MALIVQKYGGTSVRDIDRIREVAKRVVKVHERGNEVVVVLSAMAGETDRLIGLASQASPHPNERELDVLLATGEQVSVSLMAMAIEALGHQAKSFLAHQVQIKTDSAFSRARILRIDKEKLFDYLRERKIAVVAGFQGIDENGNLTTLGRGGSDTTAVALAAAMKAEVCEIYTDVDGIYTADPKVCPNPRKLRRISYDEMLELASLGAKVLHIRSVAFAKKYGVPLHVRSSFSEDEGTWVVDMKEIMEKTPVTGVTHNPKEALLVLSDLPLDRRIAAELFSVLASKKVPVDMIVQSPTSTTSLDIAFTVPLDSFTRAREAIGPTMKKYGAKISVDREVSKVAVVGTGLRDDPGMAAKIFRTLADEGIPVLAVSTSEIRIACLIPAKYTELAVRALHQAFERDRLLPEDA